MDPIQISDLQKHRLFIATPMYGGNCHGFFTKAATDLSTWAAKNNVHIQYYFLFNESLITRARNYCVDEFLRSDCTHMMFIDSDIGFDYLDVIRLLHLCNPEEGRDIVTAPYPKKTIAWEKVTQAVKNGYADDNPFKLAEVTGDYVFNPVEGQKTMKVGELVEIKEGGTGFMMIHRSVFEKYAKAYPELQYKPDHARTKNFDGSSMITAFFDCVIDPESKRYLSEDYMFSQYARKIGLRIWMAPWMRLLHVGTMQFVGNMSAIAAIGASPTAGIQSNEKTYTTNKKDLTNLGNTDTMSRQQRRAILRKGSK